jgi:hypothetical protein
MGANFVISMRGGQPGLDHFGIQVEKPDELHEVYGRLQQADRPVLEGGATTCCYDKSEKAWITDPQGPSWEAFLTLGASNVYGDRVDLGPIRPTSGACCTLKPELSPAAACCGQGAAA